jgi:integrase
MLRQQANGIWHTEFQFLRSRVHKSTRTTSKREALAFERQLKEELRQKGWEGPRAKLAKLSLGNAVSKYLEEHVRPQAANDQAYRNEAWIFAIVVKRMGGASIPIDRIDSARVAHFKAGMVSEGLAVASVNRYLASLRSVLRKAEREWGIATARPNFELMRGATKRLRTISAQEEAQLLVAMERFNPFLHRLVRFLLGTGARLGEALALTWDRVEFECDPSRARVIFTATKNGGTRTVPLPRSTADMLSGMREAQKGYRLPNVMVCERSGLGIFPYRYPQPAFTRACKRANLEDLHLHDLRHTYASRLVSAGVSLYKVSTLLGHKDPRMTARYAHLATEDLRSAVCVLN